MKISIAGSSHAQLLGVHDPLATGPLAPPGGIGTASAYADRTYDNGYVKQDPGTGNAESLDPNTTWNWGFNNPAQYNAGAQTLAFQKQGALGYTTLANTPANMHDDVLGAGLQVLLGFPLSKSGKWSVDLAFGFQAVWGIDENFSTSTYREDVRRITVTDTYDVSGIPSGSFPATGFHGTYLGPFDTPPVVPSPVIPNIPQSRASSTSAAVSTSYNGINFDVDQGLFQLSAGPQVGYAASQQLKFSFRPSIAFNMIDVSVHRTEVFVQNPAGGGSVVVDRWSDQGGQHKVSFGMGAVGGADLDLGKGFFAGVFAGYDWVFEKARVSVGPNTLSLNAGGFVAGAMFGKRF